VFAEERQQVILDRAHACGRVDVAALADDFAVSTETIRRDLTILERRGAIRRVHGGAIPLQRLGFEPALAMREGVMVAEKIRIAKAAVAELPEEGSILLDAGSTTARLAEELPTDRHLSVVTHSVSIALNLSSRENLTIILVGGRLRSRTLATVDAWALRALEGTFVDVAFIATNGISARRGLTTPDTAEAMIKRAAVGSSRRCVLLADHTKVGNDYFTRFAELSDIDTFITDDRVDRETVDEIANAGPRVVIA